jgi:hypothetical protein
MNITVTTLNDDPNGPVPGQTTLRDAINTADIQANAGSTINFQANLQGAIQLAAKLPDISNNTTIQGPPLNNNGQPVLFVQGNATAQKLYSVFTVDTNVTATIGNLLIEGGYAKNGGGILNNGNLTLLDDEIQDNQATNGGGGIYNGSGASLDLTTVILAGNSTQGSGGGLDNIGGTVTMCCGTQINGNGASQGGGGIYNLQAGDTAAKITCYDDTQISGNSDASLGGGVSNGAGATFIMYGGVIQYNFESGGMGGGVYNAGGGTVDLEQDVVIQNNTASNFGGGMYLVGGVNPSNTTLNGVTVQQNKLTGAAGKGVGVYQQNGATLTATALTDNDDPGGTPVKGA